MKYIIFTLAIVMTYISCIRISDPDARNKKSIIIGKLTNLPDGEIYLVDVYNQKRILDSTTCREGSFKFSLQPAESDKFSLVAIMHKDKRDTVREFFYKTNKLYNNRPHYIEYFLLEDSIEISGSLTDFHSKALKLAAKFKMATLTNPLIGKQSWVLYNVSLKFPDHVGDTLSFNHLKDTVKKYPYSYYLLSEIASNITTLTKKESKEILSIFDLQIKNTPLWINTEKNASKFLDDSNAISSFKLKTSNNETKSIIDTNSKAINVIIFWASWCKPCRQEIPELKKVFNKYGESNQIRMSSISFDKDFKSWRKALIDEKMPWTQFRVENEEQGQEILVSFRTNSTIPMIFITDYKGTILNKISGFDSNNLLINQIDHFLRK